ncbi:MAG: RimK family protein [Alcanivoracaceae bacterium]|nr:RimK family protein [Alcanivoracaceae bacterium]
MTHVILVVEDRKDWSAYYPSQNLMTAREYLDGAPSPASGRVQVINLCRNYRYLGPGYYCSLLAEARGHKVIPSVRTVNDLSRKALYRLQLEAFDGDLDKVMRKHHKDSERLTLNLYFGQTEITGLAELARQIFDQLPCPVLQVTLRRREHWSIESVKAIGINNLKDSEEDRFAAALEAFNTRIWRKPGRRRKYRYDLAMLVNPEEALPPSNGRALKKFIRAGKDLGINVELVGREDYTRLAEYDALFIRETTALDHHTYQFARKAEQEGMVVMDDPASILRCTNKIYFAELMQAHKVPTPGTRFLYRDSEPDLDALIDALGLPIVLKIPDGSFSRGISKAETREALHRELAGYFKQSAVVLAQEYLYTDFDWRIGILNNRPLFACQYMMSKGHWQIYHHQEGGKTDSGDFATLPIQQVPSRVLRTAMKAARPMGDGLYGVDLKQSGERLAVVEVNDNPNIDAGIEDRWLGDDLYRQVMLEFLRRMEARRLGLAL